MWSARSGRMRFTCFLAGNGPLQEPLRRRLGDSAALWAQHRWDGRRTARKVAEVYAEVLHGYSRGGGVD